MVDPVGTSSSAVANNPVAPPRTDDASTSGANRAAAAQPAVPPDVTTKLGRARTANLAATSEQLKKTAEKTSEQQLNAAKGTGTRQAVKTYMLSFGGVGLISRGAGQFMAHQKTDKALASPVNALLPLLAPWVHGGAGKASAPGADETKFVQTQSDRPAGPANASLAFKPFANWLGVGNTAVSGLSAGASKAAIDLSEGAAPKIVTETIKAATSVALLVPGAMAAKQTVNNVMGGQAELGLSLSEPIKDAGGVRGTVVTHKEPIDRGDGLPELGKISIQDGAITHTLTVRQTDAGPNITRTTEPIPPEESIGTRFVAGAKAAATAFIPDATTVRKVGALAQTMVAAQLYENLGKPALETALPDSLGKPTKEVISGLVGNVGTAVLLKLDFIPKFETFALPTNAASEVVKATVPVVGAAVAFRQISDANTSFNGLNEGHMTQYGEQKVDLMAVVNIAAVNDGLTAPVTRCADGALNVSAADMIAFARSIPVQAAPAQAAPAQAAQQPDVENQINPLFAHDPDSPAAGPSGIQLQNLSPRQGNS